MARSEKMTDGEVLAAVLIELDRAIGSQSDELATFREEALKYYYGEEDSEIADGCSSVVSTDVADMLEAVVAGILPAFETDNVITFEAMNADDEKQAQLESDAVNYFIMEENNGYIMLQEALRDALLLRNGFTKVWVEENSDKTTQSYKDLNAAELFMLREVPDDKTTIELVSLKDNGNVDGDKQPLFDATLRTTITTRDLKVASIDPTNFYYTQSHDSIFLDDIVFCAERCIYTRSDLIKMGYDKALVETIEAMSVDTQPATVARDQAGENNNSQIGTEPSQDLIETYICYFRIDTDGDGISELRKIVVARRVMLKNEPWEFVPMATGTGILQPHRINGLGLYDKLKMVQDIKTGALQQYMDNFINGNQGRVGYRKGEVDMEALTNPRPGGAVGCSNPDDIWGLPTTDIGPSAQALLNYMDQVRSARGGASLDLQSAEAQIMGETAQGIERQYSVREMFAAMMCRTLAETLIASTYRNAHKALRLYRGGSFVFRRRLGFETTDPSKWPERNKVNVMGGLSYGERNKKIGALSSVVAQQKELLQGGFNGVMVNLNGLYTATIDLAKASGLDHPEKYFVDPDSKEAKAAAAQMQQQQQAQQQMQMAMAQQQQQFQHALLQQQINFEKYKTDVETRFKYYDAQLDAQTKAAEIVGKVAGEAELELLRNKSGNSSSEPEEAKDE